MRNIYDQIGRRSKYLSYRKVFFIVTEGRVTERQYFNIFRSRNSNIKIMLCPSDNKSNPISLLKKIKFFLKNNDIMSKDEAWLVIDKDSWTDNNLSAVYKWAKSANNYGIALSTPSFEYWLLLHYEDGSGVSTMKSCLDLLSKYIPDYHKHIDRVAFSINNIKTAIKNSIAKLPNASQCDMPRCSACSTVHILVENILNSIESNRTNHSI